MQTFLLYSHHTKTFVMVMMLTLYMPELLAQTPDSKITLSIKHAGLEEFIQRIENSTGYSFIYGEDIRLKQKITLKVKKLPLHEILRLAFKDEAIDYQFSGKHILLQKKTIKAIHPRYTISGYITDGTSSETLIGANIFENQYKQGTTTNPYGFYSITLPKGNVSLDFSYIGYESLNRKIILEKDTTINILMKDNNQLQEVIILSTKPETGIQATQTGALDIPISHIKNTPAFLGETDILKAVQLIPGVQSGTEGTAGIYVRGGSPDQNLILLDGVPMYNTEHLLGFFSIFTPEAVKKVSFFKGSFPARFGGRLSSVIDVRTNEGNMQKYHGGFSIGLLASRINLEGPIIKNKTSFNVSARRSYIDLLMRPFEPKDNKFYYNLYDINAKLNHKFNDRSRLFISTYHGRDNFYWKLDENSSQAQLWSDDMKMKWGSSIVAARWNYIFNPQLFSNTTIAYNKYQFNLRGKSYQKKESDNTSYENSYISAYNSGIKDISYNIDFDYNPSPAHRIKFGTGYLYHTFQPEVQTTQIKESAEISTTDTTYNNTSNRNIYAHEVNAYIEDDIDITSKLKMNIGLHTSLFHVDRKSYLSFQPRASIRYQAFKDISVKTSYSQMHQYIHLLSNSNLALPTDLWVPVTGKVKPMKAHQYCAGIYYSGINGWEFSIEGYYKDMRNILEYKDGASFFGTSSAWEDKVEMGRGRSFGMEFFIQKTIGKTTGWISYTLSKSDRKFTKGGVNDGFRFPYKYDRRHNLNITLNHKFSKRIDASLSWTLTTGGAVTLPEGETVVIRPDNSEKINSGEDYIANRNNFRLPVSHHLNLSINFRKKTKHGERIWNISLYNAYNAMNPTFVYRDKRFVPGNGDKTILKKLTILPCIPSFTYTYKF